MSKTLRIGLITVLVIAIVLLSSATTQVALSAFGGRVCPNVGWNSSANSCGFDGSQAAFDLRIIPNVGWNS